MHISDYWGHYMKSVRIGRFCAPHFPAFGMNTEIYSVKCGPEKYSGKCGPEKLRIRTLFSQWKDPVFNASFTDTVTVSKTKSHFLKKES